jgi:hypothetical protein
LLLRGDRDRNGVGQRGAAKRRVGGGDHSGAGRNGGHKTEALETVAFAGEALVNVASGV